MLCVVNISVKIVLEVLKHVHVFLNILVSPYAWESECFVIEFPGAHLQIQSSSWFSHICKVLIYFHGVVKVLFRQIS